MKYVCIYIYTYDYIYIHIWYIYIYDIYIWYICVCDIYIYICVCVCDIYIYIYVHIILYWSIAKNVFVVVFFFPNLQVLEIYPDATQRFFHASATLALPLVDDSDNTVRQEAAPWRFAMGFCWENHGGNHGKPNKLRKNHGENLELWLLSWKMGWWMINEIPADVFTHVLHLGKAGVGLASPSRGRPKPWRSWWSRTERPRKFYDFRAWVWKCLEMFGKW